MATHVRNNRQRSRYELLVDGELVGIADYHELEGTVVFPHTVIVPERRGEGLGAVLVRHALDDSRRAGARVVARCWYVARFIDDHAEYRDLLAA